MNASLREKSEAALLSTTLTSLNTDTLSYAAYNASEGCNYIIGGYCTGSPGPASLDPAVQPPSPSPEAVRGIWTARITLLPTAM